MPDVAQIQEFGRAPKTGTLTREHSGSTRMDWDGRRTETDAAGDPLFVAENGGTRPRSALTLVDRAD